MRILLPAIVPGLLLSATGARAALEFSSLTGSSIVFAGNRISQFNFTGALDDQWKITTPGSAENLRGSFEGDAWSYGPITSLPGGVQEATVTGPEGTFSLADGTGHFATGYVNWGQLDPYRTSGGLNGPLL
jgi:hypothetical protein